MKVPEEYGGLGLSQVYYNRALALAGMWHSALATLLSAHQSIGLAAAAAHVRLRGAEARVAAEARDDPHLGVPADRAATSGSDPARVETQAVPTEDGTGYLHQRRRSCGRPTARSPTSSW